MIVAETYERKDGLWEWRLVIDENGTIVGTSHNQGFRDQYDAARAILAIWLEPRHTLEIRVVED